MMPSSKLATIRPARRRGSPPDPNCRRRFAEQAEIAADFLELPALLGCLGARLLLEPAVALEAGLDEGQLPIASLVTPQLVVQIAPVVVAVLRDQVGEGEIVPASLWDLSPFLDTTPASQSDQGEEEVIA